MGTGVGEDRLGVDFLSFRPNDGANALDIHYSPEIPQGRLACLWVNDCITSGCIYKYCGGIVRRRWLRSAGEIKFPQHIWHNIVKLSTERHFTWVTRDIDGPIIDTVVCSSR